MCPPSLEEEGPSPQGKGGGGLGPKILCTKNSPIRFSPLKVSFFPTMVILVWRGGGGAPTVVGCSNVWGVSSEEFTRETVTAHRKG